MWVDGGRAPKSLVVCNTSSTPHSLVALGTARRRVSAVGRLAGGDAHTGRWGLVANLNASSYPCGCQGHIAMEVSRGSGSLLVGVCRCREEKGCCRHVRSCEGLGVMRLVTMGLHQKHFEIKQEIVMVAA